MITEFSFCLKFSYTVLLQRSKTSASLWPSLIKTF